MVVTAAVAVTPLLLRKPQYTAKGSFILHAGDSERSSLTALAGQFGLLLPTASSALQSPQFYADLVQTREFLAPLVGDTLQLSGRPTTVPELFAIPADRRDERAVELLGKIVNATVARQTGVVGVSAVTPWPSVSLTIVQRLMERVNDFNLNARQAQAGAERRFTEQRMDAARASLRQVEERLKVFLQSNRQVISGVGGSPELTFERDRLERDVALHQQIYTSLAQANEEIRIRELRDTPAITVIESPWVSSLPDPRGRIARGLIGLVVGAVLGILLSLISDMLAQRRATHDPRVEEFYGRLAEARSGLLGWLPGRRLASGD
jgi:uncharacterized protein involved in exopolysaccharide biosynthesis